jgi:hypothetical protein
VARAYGALFCQAGKNFGAGEGNRTLVCSLENGYLRFSWYIANLQNSAFEVRTEEGKLYLFVAIALRSFLRQTP